MTPDLKQRIERAAKKSFEQDQELYDNDWDDPNVRDYYLRTAESQLRAAFPELFTDPPTHCLVPVAAVDQTVRPSGPDVFQVAGRKVYQEMDDAAKAALDAEQPKLGKGLFTPTAFEVEVMRGLQPGGKALPWGAAVGASLEFLQGAGYVTRGLKPRLTEKAEAYLKEHQDDD